LHCWSQRTGKKINKLWPNYLQIIFILKTGLFCRIQYQVRKSHSAFNRVRLEMTKVKSVFKEQSTGQGSSFPGQV
jgi:hypothetical protein